MTRLVYENFGKTVANPNKFKRPTVCETVKTIQEQANDVASLQVPIKQGQYEETTYEARFWAKLTELSKSLERAFSFGNQKWFIYK